MTALITTTQYTTYTGETLLSSQEWVLDVASEVIRAVTNRSFTYGATDLAYDFEDASQLLQLKEYPVDLTQTFTIYTWSAGDTWIELNEANYAVSDETGLVNLFGVEYCRFIRVVCTAGYNSSTMPSDLQFAVARISNMMVNNQWGDTRYQSERIGDYYYKVSEGTGLLSSFPLELRIIVNKYVNNNWEQVYEPTTIAT